MSGSCHVLDAILLKSVSIHKRVICNIIYYKGQRRTVIIFSIQNISFREAKTAASVQ